MLGNVLRNRCGRSSQWTINGAAWDWLGTGRALTFDGTDDTATFDQSVIASGECTILVEFSTANASAADRCLFSQSNSTSADHKLGLRINASHQVEAFVGADEVAFAKAVNDGKRHVAGFTRNAAGTVQVWLDGEPGGTVAGGTFPTLNRSTLGAIRSTTTTEYFPGTIGRVLVYERKLDAAEIRSRLRYFADGRLYRGFPVELFVGLTVPVGLTSLASTALAAMAQKIKVFGIASESDASLAMLTPAPMEGTIVRLYSWDMGDLSEFHQIVNFGGVTFNVQNTTVHSSAGGYALTVSGSGDGWIESGGLDPSGKTLAEVGDDSPSLRVWIYVVTLPSSATLQFAALGKNTGDLTVAIGIDPGGILQLFINGGLVESGSTAIATGVWYKIDLLAVSGAWVVRLNDGIEMQGSDTFDDSQMNPKFGLLNSVGSAVELIFDDAALAVGGFVPGGESAYLPANAAGTYQNFARGGTDSGSNWGQVDESPNDGDGTYLVSNAVVGQAETENLAAMPVGKTPNAVQAMLIAKRGQAGIPAMFARLRASGTDVDDVNAIGADGTYKPYHRVFASNPVTMAPWTESEVNAIELGAVDNHGTRVTRISAIGAVVDYRTVQDKVIEFHQIDTVETAASATANKGIALDIALNLETAIVFTQVIDRAFAIGDVENIMVAHALEKTKALVFTFPTETDTAFDIIRPPQVIVVAMAEEEDTAEVTLPTRDYALGLAETEGTAQIVGASRDYAVGLIEETDSGLAATTLKTRVLGSPVIVMHTAFAMAASTLAIIGLNATADSALGAASVKSLEIGLAEETDSIHAAAVSKSLLFGIATETDAALEIERLKLLAIAMADETDSAQALVISRSYVLGRPDETDSSLEVIFTRAVLVGQPFETDTAFVVSPERTHAIGLTEEEDTAFTMLMPLIKPVAQALETGTALDIIFTRAVEFFQAFETDTAQVIGPDRSQAFGLASATDTAHSLTLDRAYVVGVASEADTAQAWLYSRSLLIGIATDSETAQPFVSAKTAEIGQPFETDTAQLVAFARSFDIGFASTTDTGQVVMVDRAFEIGQAAEADESVHIMATYSFPIDPATDVVHTAFPLTRVKSHVVGLATETDAAFQFIVIGGRVIGVDFYGSVTDARPATLLCLLRGRRETLRFEFIDQLKGGLLDGAPTVQEVVNGKPVAGGEPGTVLTIFNIHRNTSEYTTDYSVPVMIDKAVIASIVVNKSQREPVTIRVTCETNFTGRNVVQDFEIETRG